jgi:hypothetical protein
MCDPLGWLILGVLWLLDRGLISEKVASGLLTALSL